jgi:lipoate-protein ligase B
MYNLKVDISDFNRISTCLIMASELYKDAKMEMAEKHCEAVRQKLKEQFELQFKKRMVEISRAS